MSTKSALINGTVFLGVVLVGWFLVWGEITDARVTRNKLGAVRETVDLEREVLKKLDSINQALDSQKTNVEKLEQAIPSTEEEPEILSISENLASQNGLNLVSIGISPPGEEELPKGVRLKDLPVEEQLLGKLGVTTAFVGKYEQFKSWLGSIEKNLRIVDVRKISLKVKDEIASTGEVLPAVNPSFEMEVEADTYILKK